MVNHLNHRGFYRRMIAQEVRPFVVGCKDNGIAIRQLVIEHREVLPTPARTRTKPRGDNGRGLLQPNIRRTRKDHRQGVGAVITRVKEWYREV